MEIYTADALIEKYSDSKSKVARFDDILRISHRLGFSYLGVFESIKNNTIVCSKIRGEYSLSPVELQFRCSPSAVDFVINSVLSHDTTMKRIYMFGKSADGKIEELLAIVF